MIIFLLGGNSFAIEVKCDFWQIKIRSHPLKSYTNKKGNIVQKANRTSHCRNKWENAEHWIMLFNNKKPDYWPNKSEVFKKWSIQEKIELLKLLGKIPIINSFPIKQILRAKNSKISNNPASSISETGDIVIYDQFFKESNQIQVLAHEAAHIGYDNKLSSLEKREFAKLSGWQVFRIKNNDVFVAPLNKIKEDSSVSEEEDFANYFEYYIAKPKKTKNFNIKVHNFLLKRFPK
ncbi:MAG: hypothetical protein N4A33_00900 [Bacteriovoracaceae bacterium]|nr:hypothetical protein [Bacteriovoracaceae bacterium]